MFLVYVADNRQKTTDIYNKNRNTNKRQKGKNFFDQLYFAHFSAWSNRKYTGNRRQLKGKSTLLTGVKTARRQSQMDYTQHKQLHHTVF